MSDASLNKRLAHNTLMLYARMIILVLVKLYTSRVILDVLGINDYGVWSAVSSFIVSFNFLSTPLIGAIQRFLNFEIGSGGKRLCELWSTSFILCLILALIFIAILESGGVWFLNNKMNFANTNAMVINSLFQLSVFSSIFMFLRMSYEAAIISYERMSAYAVLCIAESILLLCGAIFLKFYTTNNPLILYGIINFVAQIILFFCYKFYCNKFFSCTHFYWTFNKKMVREIGSYTGWNFFGSFCSMSASSGLNILLNMFFGVVINAAYSIMMQIGSIINQLVNNLLTAISPQIIKSYACKDFQRLDSLIINGCKYSLLLLLIPLVPIYINIDYILKIWLGNYPDITVLFCRIYIIYLFVACFSGVLSIACLAIKNIRKYQLTLGPLVLFNIILTYLLFNHGFVAQTTLYIKVAVECVILAYRLIFLRATISISIQKFIKFSFLPIMLISAIIIGCMLVITHALGSCSPSLKLIVSSISFFVIYTFVTWSIGLTRNQKQMVKTFITNQISKLQ